MCKISTTTNITYITLFVIFRRNFISDNTDPINEINKNRLLTVAQLNMLPLIAGLFGSTSPVVGLITALVFSTIIHLMMNQMTIIILTEKYTLKSLELKATPVKVSVCTIHAAGEDEK